MPENESKQKKPLSPDKLIQGILSKLGETFDGLFGRQAKASSSLAISEIDARVKNLLDSQVRDLGENGRFVPHLIQLKLGSNAYTTDQALEEKLKALENELLAAVIDHINDKRYLTYAPLKITARSDFRVEGVHIVTSFGETEKKDDEVDLSVTMPQIRVGDLIPKAEPVPAPEPELPRENTVIAKFSIDDAQTEKTLRFAPGQRLNVGRTRENDLALPDSSVSKQHASLYFNAAHLGGELIVSDVGSANGTFVNKERLAYGNTCTIKDGDMVGFGNVNVLFERVSPEPEKQAVDETITETAPEIVTETAEEEKGGPIRIELDNDAEPAA